jgi:toxin-antitoxin system PIN domain toxin
MLLPDVNVFVYAHRADEPTHDAYTVWLEEVIAGPEPFGLSVLVAVAFVRIVTNPKIYADPTPLDVALASMDRIASHPRCRIVAPATDHYGKVAELCRATKARAKLVADAQHAALAIAEGCTWVTRDGDFAKFAPHGLRWKHLVLDAPENEKRGALRRLRGKVAFDQDPKKPRG